MSAERRTYTCPRTPAGKQSVTTVEADRPRFDGVDLEMGRAPWVMGQRRPDGSPESASTTGTER
jgi:hypothetical protein